MSEKKHDRSSPNVERKKANHGFKHILFGKTNALSLEKSTEREEVTKIDPSKTWNNDEYHLVI